MFFNCGKTCEAVILLFFAVACSFIANGQGGSPSKTNSKLAPAAEWPTLRANNKRDGRVVATGEFKSRATLSQSIDYATSEAYVELTPGEKILP